MRAGRRGTGMNDKKTKEVDGRESVSMLPGVTVGVMIAVIAFVLSFDALRLVFVSSGINPLLSWGGPLCVDGTILLCTWATWGFRKGHIRGRWYPWAGLVLFSLFSVTGNALHAWLNAGGMLPTWGAPAIMSLTPRVIRLHLRRRTHVETTTVRTDHHATPLPHHTPGNARGDGDSRE